MQPSLSLACFLSVIRPPAIKFEEGTLQILPQDKAKCPYVKEHNDIGFRLFTRHNPTVYQELRIEDDEALFASNFNFNDPTVVYFTAFMEQSDDGSGLMIRESYMLRSQTNFVILDISRLEAGPWYFTAAENTWYIGNYAARFIDYMVSRGLNLNTTHLIGHSLGGQSAGVTGYAIKSGKVSRITGLDPALPLFSHLPLPQRLDPSDAQFVDVIHTDAGIFGYNSPIGHADFYPNGGISPQPGCELEVVLQEQRLLNKCDEKAPSQDFYIFHLTSTKTKNTLVNKLLEFFTYYNSMVEDREPNPYTIVHFENPDEKSRKSSPKLAVQRKLEPAKHTDKINRKINEKSILIDKLRKINNNNDRTDNVATETDISEELFYNEGGIDATIIANDTNIQKDISTMKLATKPNVKINEKAIFIDKLLKNNGNIDKTDNVATETDISEELFYNEGGIDATIIANDTNIHKDISTMKLATKPNVKINEKSILIDKLQKDNGNNNNKTDVAPDLDISEELFNTEDDINANITRNIHKDTSTKDVTKIQELDDSPKLERPLKREKRTNTDDSTVENSDKADEASNSTNTITENANVNKNDSVQKTTSNETNATTLQEANNIKHPETTTNPTVLTTANDNEQHHPQTIRIRTTHRKRTKLQVTNENDNRQMRFPNFKLQRDAASDDKPQTRFPNFKLQREIASKNDRVQTRFKLQRDAASDEKPQTRFPNFKLQRDAANDEKPQTRFPNFKLQRDIASKNARVQTRFKLQRDAANNDRVQTRLFNFKRQTQSDDSEKSKRQRNFKLQRDITNDNAQTELHRQKRFISIFKKSEDDSNFLFKMLDFLIKNRKNVIPVITVMREINTLVKSGNGELNHYSKEQNNYIGAIPTLRPIKYDLAVGETGVVAFVKKLLGLAPKGGTLSITET